MSAINDFVREFRQSTPEQQAQILEEQKGHVTRGKSAQTRSITSATKWLNSSSQSPDETTVAELSSCIDHVRLSIDKLEEQVLKLVNICDVPDEVTS